MSANRINFVVSTAKLTSFFNTAKSRLMSPTFAAQDLNFSILQCSDFFVTLQ